MSDPDQPDSNVNDTTSPEAQLIARQIASLCYEFKRYNARSRRMIFAVMLLAGVAIVTVGSAIWGLILNMEDDMNDMNASMVVMRDDMALMRGGIDRMSGVMDTMKTMGDDVKTMTGAVSGMSQSVGWMSTMTPAVQRMSTDTNSMQRDMHWMMPFNWMP
jgi:hypothetical protein